MTTVEITARSTMKEVLDAFPSAQRALMRRYHIGGCSSCGFTPTEHLDDVLKRHSVQDVGEVITHIKDSHEQEQRIQLDPKELSEALKSDAPPKLLDVRNSKISVSSNGFAHFARFSALSSSYEIKDFEDPGTFQVPRSF